MQGFTLWLWGVMGHTELLNSNPVLVVELCVDRLGSRVIIQWAGREFGTDQLD